MKQTLDLLERFREMELEASGTYLSIARQSEGQIAAVCKQFAAEELQHAETFEEMQSQQAFLIDLDANPQIAALIDASSGDIPLKTGETTKNLFMKALGAEKRSIAFYTELQKLMRSDSEMHGLLDRLIQVERNHMYTILNILHEQA